MSTYNRRAFIKRSAMLTASLAASRFSLPSLTSEAAVNTAANARGSDHPFFTQSKKRPEVIAHRGGSGQWPGETIFAYEQATKIGVDILEMDIHSTRDGELVLMHNKSVDDTTDGKGRIHDFTLAELKKLDAGFRWTADGGKTFPFRGQGITVATLKEVFEKFSQMRMNIEIKQSKPSLVEPFCKMIQEHGMTNKVLVASFWDNVMKDFRRRCPEVATSASTQELAQFIVKNVTLHDGSFKPETDALQATFHVINKKFVDKGHQLNFQVHAWTVNDTDDMKHMIALGVDGIITDYPERLLALLNRTSHV